MRKREPARFRMMSWKSRSEALVRRGSQPVRLDKDMIWRVLLLAGWASAHPEAAPPASARHIRACGDFMNRFNAPGAVAIECEAGTRSGKGAPVFAS